MENQTKSNWQNLLIAATAIFSFLFVANFSTFAQESWKSSDEWRNQYKIGDKVQFSISGNASDFQVCTVSENSPQAVMRVKCEDFKQWSAGSYIVYGKNEIRPQIATKTVDNNNDQTKNENETQKKWSEFNKWRSGYKVGDKIQVTLSEKPEDFQTCTVTENDPQFVMRVVCDDFKHWEAGEYIVHSEANLKLSKTQSTNKNNKKNTPRQKDSSSSGLKVGEYACYGSGGSILAGLAFKVLSGNRYTDLEGGNAGTFVISGDTVKFRSGHLDGQTGRELSNYNFRIGTQATCEPF